MFEAMAQDLHAVLCLTKGRAAAPTITILDQTLVVVEDACWGVIVASNSVPGGTKMSVSINSPFRTGALLHT